MQTKDTLRPGGMSAGRLPSQAGARERTVGVAPLVSTYIDPHVLQQNISIIKVALLAVAALLVQAYFQTDSHVERTYPCIHELEERINELSGHKIIGRDGKAYKDKYPLFLWWSW